VFPGLPGGSASEPCSFIWGRSVVAYCICCYLLVNPNVASSGIAHVGYVDPAHAFADLGLASYLFF
jgi:hypothetical protein